MKNILLASLLLISVCAKADDRSDKLLKAMTATLRGYKQYRVEFSLRADQSSANIEGYFVVSGAKYHIKVQHSEVFSDGKLKYEVNTQDKEVLIDKIDPTDKGILANPTVAFDFPDEVFTHVYAGETTYEGRKCEKVTMRVREKGNPVEHINLMIDQATGLPAGVSYKMENVSDPVVIKILSVKAITSVMESVFTFDKTKYKGFEIIDFR